jgi:hypothetical protein
VIHHPTAQTKVKAVKAKIRKIAWVAFVLIEVVNFIHSVLCLWEAAIESKQMIKLIEEQRAQQTQPVQDQP